MSKLLVPAICALLALPQASFADDHGPGARPPGYHRDYGRDYHGDYHGDRDCDRYRYVYRGRYPYPAYGYGHQQSYPAYGYGNRSPTYYGGGGHHRGGDNDDALWAIGGLIVGAVVMDAVHKADQPSDGRHPASTSAPPRREQTCIDETVYDSDGTPRIERHCGESTRP